MHLNDLGQHFGRHTTDNLVSDVFLGSIKKGCE